MIFPWQDRDRRLSWLKAIVFVLLFAPAIWLVDQVATGEFGPVPLGGMTYWSGVWATTLLLLALAVTPAAVILRWSRLILVRRMIGVAALAYTIAHLFIYFALRFWNFASIAHEMATRLSLIIATLATLGLVALGVTSLDAAVRRMGRNWQLLHNAVYACAALALVHYLMSPDSYPEQALLSGAFFWLMAWRALQRRRLGTNPAALAALAAVSCVFTAVLEALWIWAYHGYGPGETFGNDFNLVFGIAPAWKILALGLVIALAAAIRNATGHARLEPRGARGSG
jgi:sulfoxide reductase heme-binding subunit YedZ